MIDGADKGLVRTAANEIEMLVDEQLVVLAAFDKAAIAEVLDCETDALPEILGDRARFDTLRVELPERKISLAEIRAAGRTCEEREKATHARAVSHLRAALQANPGTGEPNDVHDLAEMYARRAPRDLIPAAVNPNKTGLSARGGHFNQVYARAAVYFYLGPIRWTPAIRKLFLSEISRRETAATSRSDDERDARRRFRDLRKAFAGAGGAHAATTLAGIVAHPAATEAEILWAIAECLIANRGAGLRAAGFGDAFDQALLGAFVTERSRLLEFVGRCFPLGAEGALPADVAGDGRPHRSTSAQSPLLDMVPPRSASDLVTLTYVLSPVDAQPRVESVVSSHRDASQAILRLLRKHADVQESVESLARAIDHFAFSTTKQHRALWERETLASGCYHKIRRGTARIIIRQTADELLFHASTRASKT